MKNNPIIKIFKLNKIILMLSQYTKHNNSSTNNKIIIMNKIILMLSQNTNYNNSRTNNKLIIIYNRIINKRKKTKRKVNVVLF